MDADVVVPTTATAGIPQQRSTSSARSVAVEHHPVRRLRRRALCRLGVHTSVFTWAPGRGVWCNHCRTLVADA